MLFYPHFDNWCLCEELRGRLGESTGDIREVAKCNACVYSYIYPFFVFYLLKFCITFWINVNYGFAHFIFFVPSYDVIYVYGVYLKILKGIACMYEDDDLSEKQFYLFYQFQRKHSFSFGWGIVPSDQICMFKWYSGVFNRWCPDIAKAFIVS